VPIYAAWFPTLHITLTLLSKIYRAVEIHVFQDMAHQVPPHPFENHTESHVARMPMLFQHTTFSSADLSTGSVTCRDLVQALSACNESLLAAAKVLRETRGNIDADLFLVSLHP
jgi:hypothetical protein